MGNKDLRIQFPIVLLIACVGCLMIGVGLVYPIYSVSNGQPQYSWGGVRYDSVRPISGMVFNASPEYHVDFDTSWLYEVTLQIRNFYTNGTPVSIIILSNGEQIALTEFYNLTAEPINESFSFDYPSSITIVILCVGNTTLFSGWVLIQGIQVV
ncbi:MAG: hypothetical protein ACFFDU_04545, partial [Candidatus Thorarchaeota archaeon]